MSSTTPKFSVVVIDKRTKAVRAVTLHARDYHECELYCEVFNDRKTPFRAVVAPAHDA